jgi:hypothetical protein
MSTRSVYVLGYTGPGMNVNPGHVIYLWSPDGLVPDISTSTGDPEFAPLPPTWYINFGNVNPYVMCLKVSENALVGESYFRTLGDVTYEVNVVAPYDNPYTIPLGGTETDIQDAINAGYSPIYLQGDYAITTPLVLTGPYVAPVVVIDGQNWS